MEIPVGPYRVDIVAKEALTESRAVIENQLERTDHDQLRPAGEVHPQAAVFLFSFKSHTSVTAAT
jgi:hypothetical protein